MSPRVVRFALRLLIAAGGLALVVRYALPEGDALARLRSAWAVEPGVAWAWTGAAAALLGLSYAIGAIRFRLLLAAIGVTSRLSAVLRAYLIASFFNLVLPGFAMGDVYRIADARHDSGSGATALGVVALERLLGLAALGAMVLVAAPLLPAEGAPGVRLAVAGLGAFVLLAPLVPLAPQGRRLGERVAAVVGRAWPRGGEAAARALRAIAGIGRRPDVVARAFGLSLANQGLPVLAVLALAMPLDASVPAGWFAVIVPCATLASLLPISIGGTGVREGIFVAAFGAVGMRPEVALVLSLSMLFVAFAWGLVGLGLFLATRRDLGARAPA